MSATFQEIIVEKEHGNQLVPVLRMKVGDYELDVFANKEGNVHSGVEVFKGQIHAYFKMVHEDTDPLGIR